MPSSSQNKKKEKEKATTRNARDLQTPDPRGDSVQPEDHRKDKKVHFTESGGTVNEPVSPTQGISESVEGNDHAAFNIDTDENSAGSRSTQSNDKADDTESDDAEDTDMGDADADAPMQPEEPDPLPDWVQDIIQKTSSKWDNQINQFFENASIGNPNFTACEEFFTELNNEIVLAGQKHSMPFGDVISPATYKGLEAFSTIATNALKNPDRSEGARKAWQAYHNIYDLIGQWNKRNCLPEHWNLRHPMIEEAFNTPDPFTKSEPTPNGPEATPAEPEPTEPKSTPTDPPQSNTEQEDLSDEGLFPSTLSYSLDDIDRRTLTQQRRLAYGEVVYWWKAGVGSQTFVQYGDQPCPIYRIRAGSYQFYDKKSTLQVLPSKSRGSMKRVIPKDGVQTEIWQYTRNHVKAILGVGFKIEGDKEYGADSQRLMKPGKVDVLPQARLIVLWSDGEKTLEDRNFGRRIMQGKDHGIYQIVKEMENAYWDRYTPPDDLDSDIGGPETETEIDTEVDSDTESDTDTETESEKYARSSKRRTSRVKTRPQRRSKRNRSPTEKDKKIRQLQKELAKLELSSQKERSESGKPRQKSKRSREHRRY